MEDFLDMCIGQYGIWVGENIEPEKKMSELMPTEPYLLGSHSGCCGICCPARPTSARRPARNCRACREHLPKGWNWGYRSMTTVKGLFTAGDGVAPPATSSPPVRTPKAVRLRPWSSTPSTTRTGRSNDTDPAQLAEDIYKPVRNFLEHKDYTTAIDINPNYITPKMLQFRLQKIMDEYVAGVTTTTTPTTRCLPWRKRSWKC
ncbi:MAG: hypothetical protein R3E40_02095 [Rhodocyclaceae bacterium]